MLGSPILDLAIGMAFIYLLLSLIASVLQEILATLMQARSANLRRGLHSLFSGDSCELDADGNPGKLFVDAVYQHGLVRGLYQDPSHDLQGELGKGGKFARDLTLWKSLSVSLSLKLRALMNIVPPGSKEQPADLLLPAYIPARTFALALTDLLDHPAYGGDTLSNIQAYLRDLKSRNQKALDAKTTTYENKAVEALLALAADAQGKMEKFQANLQNWYNDSMDRASGWYKRYVQRILLCIGILIAAALNVDSVHIARTLWFDHDARQGLASAADVYVKNHPDLSSTGAATQDKTFNPPQMQKALEDTVNTFNAVGQKSMLPVGWRRGEAVVPAHGEAWYNFLGRSVLMLLGWCITAGALSLGAPFWFDMLNKIMVVRGTVKPSEKSPNEASKS